MYVVISIVCGTLLGEAVDLDALVRRFGEWLKRKTGNAKDPVFVDAFVTASVTVCVGAMAVVGAVQDGMMGDISILCTKAVLDFVIILVMTCSLGRVAESGARARGVLQKAAQGHRVFFMVRGEPLMANRDRFAIVRRTRACGMVR